MNIKLLEKARVQLSVWEEVLARVLTQLGSLSNLMEQLETLQRCSSAGKLGVITQDPMVVQLLQGKLVKKMERILPIITKERNVLREVVQKLKRFAKEGEVALEVMTKRQGLETCCSRTSERFSFSDHVSWLRQLHCSYRSDFDGKMAALDSLQYTTDSMRNVCAIWEKSLPEIEECLSYLNYTLKGASQ